jgi:SAM-dependent methyltransferase
MNQDKGRVIQQPIDAKKGEIEFRKKLYEQQVLGQNRFADEFNTNEMIEIVRKRAIKTYDQVKRLQDRGIVTSPYVEIGAERCQRSLVMENQLDSHGAAVDISFHSLQSCDFYGQVMHLGLAPTRICCDANKLPFISDSVPFIFCYETLHHFPDLTPIIREVHRVLAPGGCFFFDEEGFERKIHLTLYDAGKMYSKENRAKGTIRRISDAFFGKMSCNETEHGIIENEKITLGQWKRALSTFEKQLVTMKTGGFRTDLFDRKSFVRTSLHSLLGGEITGCCFKGGTLLDTKRSVEDFIACPSCLENRVEAKLRKRNSSFLCPNCGTNYPSVEGVTFLFSQAILSALYPDI